MSFHAVVVDCKIYIHGGAISYKCGSGRTEMGKKATSSLF